jgi:hypothetical protein
MLKGEYPSRALNPTAPIEYLRQCSASDAGYQLRGVPVHWLPA